MPTRIANIVLELVNYLKVRIEAMSQIRELQLQAHFLVLRLNDSKSKTQCDLAKKVLSEIEASLKEAKKQYSLRNFDKSAMASRVGLELCSHHCFEI